MNYMIHAGSNYANFQYVPFLLYILQGNLPKSLKMKDLTGYESEDGMPKIDWDKACLISGEFRLLERIVNVPGKAKSDSGDNV